MELPPAGAPSMRIQYVTYQVPTPQLILVPTTQEARVTRFRHSTPASFIKISFSIALVIWALVWAFIALLLIIDRPSNDGGKASREGDKVFWEGIPVLLTYCVLQFLSYSSTLYAVMMVGRLGPCTIRCIAGVSLLMLLVLVLCDLSFLLLSIADGTGGLMQIFLLVLSGEIILIVASILFLCQLWEIYQNDEVQVHPERQAHVNPVTSMQVVNQ